MDARWFFCVVHVNLQAKAINFGLRDTMDRSFQ